MSGRVAAVAKQPVFNLMRHRLGLKLGLLTLVASVISTLITCAAEVGGMGLILHYLTGWPYLLMAIASTVVLMASMWVLPFKWIERTYGLLGLLMLSFAAALVAIHAPWGKIAGGFVPHVPSGLSTKELLAFAYFVVAILSAVLFPYETYFYSSGGIEEQWGPKDLATNRVTSIVGMSLGSLLAISILANSAQLFGPANVGPEIPGSAALEVAIPFGSTGLLLALLGMLFAVAGAAVETCMSNAYSVVAILRLGMGPAQEAVGSAALHHRLDCLLPRRAGDRADRHRSDDAGRICRAVLDPRPAADLSAADAAGERPQIYEPICERAARQIAWLVVLRASSPPPRSRPFRSIC